MTHCSVFAIILSRTRGNTLSTSKTFTKILSFITFKYFLIKSGYGDFPSDWRKAIIIPIPEPGKDTINPTNYPPIVLTSCICQVILGRLAFLLEVVQEGWSCLVSCQHRSYIFDTFIHPKEGSSTSVWALSVYSDSSPHFGGVQSSRSDKNWYIW